MNKNEFFTLGLKWIGVYCLTAAVGQLFELFPVTLEYATHLRRTVPGMTASGWLAVIGPAGFAFVGVYLIKDGSFIRYKAFRDRYEFDVSTRIALLDSGLKLFGVYLVAGSLPGFLWVAANVLIVLRAAPYLSVENEMEGIRDYLLLVLSTIGFGICCFVYSRKLSGIAFRVSERSAR